MRTDKSGLYEATERSLKELNDVVGVVNSILDSYTEKQMDEYFVSLKSVVGKMDRLLTDNACRFKAIFEVIEAYIVAHQYIDSYCELAATGDATPATARQLNNGKQNIISAQQSFSEAKLKYLRDNKYVIDTFPSMLEELRARLADEQKRLSNILVWECRLLQGKNEGELNNEHGLPRKIEIGACYENNAPVLIDMEKRGNIIINAGKALDESLVKTVSAIILQYLKAFPIGSLKIKIWDPEKALTTSLRFTNGFNAGEASLCKDIISVLNGELRELLSPKGDLETITNGIQGNLTGGIKDLYDLYASDNTVSFTLVVIAGGLANELQYSGNKLLKQLSAFMDSSKIYHCCGVRFLMVNDYNKTGDGDGMLNVAELLNNADVVVDCVDDKYMIDGKSCSLISVDGDYEVNIENECKRLAGELSKRESSAIPYEKIGFGTEFGDVLEACYQIPIGLSGTKTVYMPFSCGNEKGTDEGANIGFMVIGKSGSGKSSLLHSLIINGSMRYSPRDLQFWILDFKANAAASHYFNSDKTIPHIKLVAPESKIEDAYCIFENLIAEINRRNALFKSVAKEEGRQTFDNVAEYNRFVVQSGKGYEYLPRIIVVIDEAQTMVAIVEPQTDVEREFRTMLFGLIEEITTKSRSSGIHFAMLAQNLNNGIKFKESFVTHINGRATFKEDADQTRQAGFGELFNENAKQIENLNAREMYFTYSPKTIEKVRISSCLPETFDGYFARIVERYPDKPQILKIGEKEIVTPSTVSTKHEKQFGQYITENADGEAQTCIVGENCYTLDPVEFSFTRRANCACAVVGSNHQISSSLMTSLLMQLNKPQNKLYIADGKFDCEDLPFAIACNALKLSEAKDRIFYKVKDINLMIKDVWTEFVVRRRDRDNEVVREYQPVFIFINDLDGFEKYKDNIMLHFGQDEEDERDDPFAELDRSDDQINEKRIEAALTEIFKQGYRLNMYLIISLAEHSPFHEYFKMTENTAFFNETNLDGVDNAYLLKDLLGSIRGQETFAYARLRQVDTKIRPILYNSDDGQFIENVIRRNQK